MGGATFNRAAMVANTRKFICGKVRRELIQTTLHVYPIKNFGAIEEGEHRFCELATNRCEGIAKFVMVWQEERRVAHHQRAELWASRRNTGGAERGG